MRCLRHEQYDTYIKFAKSQRGLQTEHGFSIWHKRFDAILQIMRGKKVSVFGMKPFKSSSGLGIKLTGAFSVFGDSGRKTTSLMESNSLIIF